MNTRSQPLPMVSTRWRHPRLEQLALTLAGVAIAVVAACLTAWPAWLVPCALLPVLGLLAEINS
jgi:hypothetical protein